MNIRFNPQIDNTIAYFPKRYVGVAIGFYLLALFVCFILFSSHALPFYIVLMGIVSIVLFFNGSFTLGKSWTRLREKSFIKKVFWMAFWIRLVHIVIIYFLNQWQYGTFYESSIGDIMWYVPTALQAVRTTEGNLWEIILNYKEWSNGIPDAGYQTYLCLTYILQGAGMTTGTNYEVDAVSYIWLPLLMKAVFGAWTCVLMYRIAQRHFGENVARMTAIFCMLQWNMIWWCGSMMKETEMVWLSCLFAERMDRVLMGYNIKPWFIAVTVFIGLLIFTFRSALFMTAFAATILAIVMQQNKKLSIGKKVLAGIMIAIAMGLAVGDNIKDEITTIVDRAQSDHQRTNMEWRASSRVNANRFAKYAGTAVFAPLIFTIPFPNMVYTYQNQEMLMQVNGGNFEKNVLSFFVIFAMFQLLWSGAWRQHVFPIAYLIGYLAALALSEFAQSGRFHMPAMPFLMLFAAYGLTMVTSRKHKQWFTYALIAEVGFCVFWSWFKLKGQGMI